MMKKIILLFLLMKSLVASADEAFEMGRTIRSLGMGGMYIPIATDNDAVFYNPAALARGKDLSIELINIQAGINGQEALDLASTGSSITSPSSYNQFFGKKIWLDASGRAGVSMPNFGFGYLTQYRASLELHNPGYPQFQTNFLNDSVTAVGGALTFGDKIYGGMTLKKISRWGGDTVDLGLSTVANSSSLSSLGDNFTNKGEGYGLDFAVMKEFDAPTSPSLALVWQDVGNTSFTWKEGTAAPPHIPQNLSLGLGGSLDLFLIDLAYGVEMRHLLEPDIQAGNKVHLGAELSLPLIDVRAGVSQGYMSYGVGLNFLIFHIDAVSYTEELGAYPGQTGQNRILAGLSIDLSFDANFHFTDNNGKKRKLKQRR